jgi:membrane-associated phospholipid phosphatase
MTSSLLALRRILWLFTVMPVFMAGVFAQTPQPTPKAVVPAASPSSSVPRAKTAPLERQLFKNILRDQAAIWTAPLHIRRADAAWLLPLGVSSAALIATDGRTSFAVRDKQKLITVSHAVSFPGSGYGSTGIVSAFYLIGLARHDKRARETGLLAAEALINASIVSVTFKGVTQRQRPLYNDSRGRFFSGGTAFPSGHAAGAWSIASVVADEYKHRPLVRFGAYGLATAVSVARYTGRNHYLGDSIVGGAIGYGIGHYVYRKHHNPQNDSSTGKEVNNEMRSKFFPMITPHYDRQARDYGVMLRWGF